MLPRITFGPQGSEEIGGWEETHDEEMHTLYSLLNIFKPMKSSTKYGQCMKYA
jgi:hypothetical protein